MPGERAREQTPTSLHCLEFFQVSRGKRRMICNVPKSQQKAYAPRTLMESLRRVGSNPLCQHDARGKQANPLGHLGDYQDLREKAGFEAEIDKVSLQGTDLAVRSRLLHA